MIQGWVAAALASEGPSLHPGAVEHYQDARAYEQRYENRLEDVEYYVRRTRSMGSILEYGAGAGRLTLRLCAPGRRVLAIDASAAMVARLKERLAEIDAADRGRIKAVVADMRTFSTKRRFDCVIAAFHTVSHLYSVSDVAAFLERACAHLVPGGTLLFDVPLPRIDMTGYDPIAQVHVMEFGEPGGTELLTQRWFHPQEVCMHLHYAGFGRVRLGSDFTNDSITPETGVVCVSARKL